MVNPNNENEIFNLYNFKLSDNFHSLARSAKM